MLIIPPFAVSPIKKLAFVVNSAKAGATDVAANLTAIARNAGATTKSTDTFPVTPGFLKGQDACCVIGGDGTLLSAAGEAAREQVPIIGVNRGSLGFLTTFSSEEARSDFAALLAGNYQIAERQMLECRAGRESTDLALNDVLIKHTENSRLARLEVRADGELVTFYTCDGLILSTATGSTAYNLSAGGPIIHPSADVVAMTPICPHTLTNRTIIFRKDVRLEVKNLDCSPGLLVAMDGQRNVVVTDDSSIQISIAATRLKLAQRVGYSHFAVVRTKLKWSGGFLDH